MSIKLPSSQLQIDFSYALEEIRALFLQEALGETVRTLDLGKVDRELKEFVSPEHLSLVASRGLRGELVFAVPCVLSARPKLLAYYRLVLGFSQKALYLRDTGVSSFKAMEERGTLTASQSKRLPELCRAFVQSAQVLLDGIGVARLTAGHLDDLALLTLGPQLRGGRNVKLGVAGITNVFQAIRGMVERSIVNHSPSILEIRNAAGRKVLIEIAADPDIVIREQMSEGGFRNVIAIEVKGGTDFSNVHNRLGEAEKSHQKARANDYNECWTVVNVDRIDLDMARRESPTTSRFYRLSTLLSKSGEDYKDFRDRIVSLTGVKATRRK